jgi:hypothetical protein
MDAWIAVGGGRAVIQGETCRPSAQLDTFLKDLILLPELKDILFNLGKIDFAINGAEHS